MKTQAESIKKEKQNTVSDLYMDLQKQLLIITYSYTNLKADN